MNKETLFESLSAVPDELLDRSEKQVKSKSHTIWKSWAVCAACVCLIAAAAVTMSDIPKPPAEGEGADIDTIQPAGIPDDSPGYPSTIPDSSEHTEPVKYDWDIVFNDTTGAVVSDGALKQGFCLFGDTMTKDELNAALPDVTPGWMDATGSALYYGSKELAQLQLDIKNDEWDGKIRVNITETGKDVFTDCICIITPESAEVTHFGAFEFTAWQYTDAYSDYTLLWTEFERGGLTYKISTDCPIADADKAKADLYDLMYCYASDMTDPDLSSFSPRIEIEWIDEKITLSDAMEYDTFGAYMLQNVPSGFTEESIRRYKDQHSDYLSGLWTRGYDSLSWRVSYLDEYAEKRITAVDDTVNYDLSLYPIPRAESVPEKLREIVDNPVFRIEELTLDAVYKRAYTVQDAGDSDGYRMEFSVLYSDIVVCISTKGLSPEWVYETLISLK